MRTLDQIDLKYCTAKQLLNIVKDAIDKYGENNVSFDLDIEYDYGSESPIAYLTCSRDMTPLEEEAEQLVREQREQSLKKIREQQYAQLKKEFEGK